MSSKSSKLDHKKYVQMHTYVFSKLISIKLHIKKLKVFTNNRLYSIKEMIGNTDAVHL